MRGTLLNTATVAVGSLVGLAVGRLLPEAMMPMVLGALGVVTILIGLKQAWETRNIMLIAGALTLGGILGFLMGIQPGLEFVAGWVKQMAGGGGRFTEGLVTSFVLFCIGPMTLMGCLQDGLEGKSDLLNVKSLMDGIAAVFLAATFGVGVLFAAPAVLIFQGALTLMARPLSPIAQRPALIREAAAVGGLMLIFVGFGLLEIRKTPTANFLPALVLAPLAAAYFLREEPA